MEGAWGNKRTWVGVVGLVGEDPDGGRRDDAVGCECPYVGQGVGESCLDEGVLGEDLVVAAVMRWSVSFGYMEC